MVCAAHSEGMLVTGGIVVSVPSPVAARGIAVSMPSLKEPTAALIAGGIIVSVPSPVAARGVAVRCPV